MIMKIIATANYETDIKISYFKLKSFVSNLYKQIIDY